MKKLLYICTLAIFFASCTKEGNDQDLQMYDPSQLNELQENAVNVVAQYAEDNIKSLKNGDLDKSDFYEGLLATLAQYLADNTNGLDILGGVKGGVPYDICYDVLKTQRDSLRNLNIAEDTVGGVFRQPNAYEESLSEAYHEIREAHIDLRHQGLNVAHDMEHSSLLTRAYNELDSDEANHIAAKIHPVLQMHNMFESGGWDDLKAMYGANDGKLISCWIIASTAFTVVEYTCAASELLTWGGVIWYATSSKSWGLPSTTTEWEHIHINNVFAACSSLLELVENHLDTE